MIYFTKSAKIFAQNIERINSMDILNQSLLASSYIRQLSEMKPVPEGSDSGTQFEILKQYIEDFQNSLDSEHEVGMLLTNFGQNILLRITYISYEYPALIIFKGYVNDKESTLIQHVNQLNFLLTSVEKDSDRPKRKIGFLIREE